MSSYGNCSCASKQNMDEETCEIFNCTTKDLIKSGFYVAKFVKNVVCCACGWESGERKMPLSSVNFIHSIQSPGCVMVKNIPESCKNLIGNPAWDKDVEDVLTKSYLLWPKSFPKVEDLVKSGFYYTGIEDAVTCISCKVTLEDWQSEDIPHEEHKRVNPNCNLVLT